MPRERSQTRKVTRRAILFQAKAGARKAGPWGPGAGRGPGAGLCGACSFREMEMLWKEVGVVVALPRECTTCRRLVHFIAVNFALHDCQLHKGAIRGLEKAGGCGALTGCWAGSVCVLPESLPQLGRWAPSRGEGLAQRCSTKRRGHTARKPQTVPGLRPDLRSPADLQGSLWAEPSWTEAVSNLSFIFTAAWGKVTVVRLPLGDEDVEVWGR